MFRYSSSVNSGIPSIDSNADPNRVDFPIPGNDDAVKSLDFLVSKVVEALKSSKSKKDVKSAEPVAA